MLDPAGLNICFIAGTLGQGGAERQLFYALTTLRRLGARVTLLSLTQGEFWEDQIRNCGVTVRWIGQWKSRLARSFQVISALRRDPPDLIQSQHFYTNLYAAAAARVLGRLEIGALRSDTFSETLPQAFTGQLSLRAPRKIAANSRAAINNALTMGVPAERLHFLPNVVDSDLFRPAPSRESDVVKLLAVGRLSGEKRFDRFISLVSRLRKEAKTEVRGIIVGDGPQRECLRRLSSELGLDSSAIQFKGEVTEITSVYQEADILALTSEFEGTPNVILEALSSGLPVVAARVGGVPEIVENNVTGYLVEADDESSMADAALRLIDSRDLRRKFGRAARHRIELNHSLDLLPRLLMNLYQAVLV